MPCLGGILKGVAKINVCNITSVILLLMLYLKYYYVNIYRMQKNKHNIQKI